MFWMMNEMNRVNRVGPRGRMYGHRGFPRGGYRPMGAGFGLGGLFLLPALLFGGWMIVAVVGMVFSGVIMILGSIFSGIGHLANGVFSGVTSVGAIAVGVLIGLALFFRVRNGKAAENEDGEEAEEE